MFTNMSGRIVVLCFFMTQTPGRIQKVDPLMAVPIQYP